MLQEKNEELSNLSYNNMAAGLYGNQVITQQEQTEINALIGNAQMEKLLRIITTSLRAKDTTKYKGFLKAMEKSQDPGLRNKAKELGKWFSIVLY